MSGKDAPGKGTIEKGEISANNEAAVRMQLRRQQIQALKIHTKPKTS